MLTQWNVVAGGVVGLRYEALPVVFDSVGVPPDDRPDVFDGLRIMEDAALEAMRAKT